MKRILSVLISVLLCLMLTIAAQAADYQPYRYKTAADLYPVLSPTWLDEHTWFQMAWSDSSGSSPWHLLWMRDGVVYRDYAFGTPETHDNPGMVIFLPVNEERCHVLRCVFGEKDGRTTQQWEVDLWEENSLTLLNKLPDTVRMAHIGSYDHFAMVDTASGQPYDLVWFDYYGNEVSRFSLPDNVSRIRYAGYADDRTWVVSFGHNFAIADTSVEVPRLRVIDGHYSDDLFACIAGNSYCTWQKMTDETYPAWAVCFYDPNGHEYAGHRLAGNRVLLNIFRILRHNDGTCTLFGTAIANSRRVYRAWKMELDADGCFVSIDVRDCSYHGDYDPVMMVTDDGEAMLYLHAMDEQDVPPVMIPFDALDHAENPGITWQ